MFLVPLAALGLLASCAESGTSTSTITPTTFAQQCEAAGIEFTYVDPNAAYYEYESKPANDADIDLELGASGEGTDNASDTSWSYYTLDYAMSRLTTYWQTYSWVEAEEGTEGATTIAEAAALENAKYVSELFPNDGKTYTIEAERGWPYASVAWATVNEDGTPRVTTAIPGAKKAEDGTWHLSCYLTMKAVVNNLIRTGKCMALLYEWHPENGSCTGGRITLEVDWTNTKDAAGNLVTQGSTVDSAYVAFDFKVTHLYAMGYVYGAE